MAAVADKQVKQPARSTLKVFDVSKPNKQAASATSRPVIVSNRPIMQDPMMQSGTQTEMQTGRSDGMRSETSAQIADDSAKKEPQQEIVAPAGDTQADSSLPAEVNASHAPTTEESPSKVKMTINPLSDAEKQADAPETKPEQSEPQPADDTAPESAPLTEDNPDGLPEMDKSKDEQELTRIEDASKKQAELEVLVESKEYFLPINAVELRRSKVINLLGVVLILALGLLLIDLMMDVGFLRIPGVNPLTHFFSA